ncbi:MAG TPA: glycoside hydrolase family 13 protein [Bacteroidales bacterium]|nr:glycoside hydrolase family 13 protein [Bacteroidales bacterium]
MEPPFWWTGFKNPELQILVHGKNITRATVTFNYPGVLLEQVERTENPNYLFLDLKISAAARPGFFNIFFKRNDSTIAIYPYTLRDRLTGSSRRKGFSSADVIYLITPDRFANGDPSNDSVPGLRQGVNRSDPNGRHGGDIKGILDHLDYIKDLGATAIWINPLLENDMLKYSYHGYSTTDYYKTDPRFGSNADYLALSDAIHKRGMKLIMDMVFNHCGSYHWWMNDLPSPDWINQFPEYTRSSFRSSSQLDPYASQYDSIEFVKGWFDKTMPDLNQHNPFVAKYLIQNSIWWIEYAGLDGIRQDTYPYCFRDFMADWDRAVLTEYPDFNIVGECWATYPASIAYWQKDALNRDHYNSWLPSVFDFAMYDALRLGFMEKDGWSTGISRLYEILYQDFSYPDPSHIVVFADSHDVNRYYDAQGNDIRKVKMGLAFILTTRGIPEIYYGTEVLMTTGADKGDGFKRRDFPGGWPGDAVNAFVAKGRTPDQNDMFNWLETLLNWRKGKDVIHTGKLTQFVPRDGIYVYFRYNESDTVMVIMNNNETDSKTIDRNAYQEFLKGFQGGREVISGQSVTDIFSLQLLPKSVVIIEFNH